MPIYEFRCAACNRRTSVFVRSISSPVSAKCEHCGSAKLSRVMSKFAVHGGRIDMDNLENMDVDENDPRAVARFARQMSDEMGEDMGPEFDEMVGRMEAGEHPDAIAGDDGGFDDVDDDF